MNTPSSKRPTGFSLIELLVVLAVIAVLASIVIAVIGKSRTSASRVDVVSSMRQVGTAIQMYISENHGEIPRQSSGNAIWPVYKSTDTRSLGYKLWPYMDVPAPKESYQSIEAFAPKAYRDYIATTDYPFMENNPSMQLNSNASFRDDSGVNINPWRDSNPNGVAAPRIGMLLDKASDIWAIMNIDKGNYGVSSAGYYPRLPDRSLYFPKNVVLYFDWHVNLEDAAGN